MGLRIQLHGAIGAAAAGIGGLRTLCGRPRRCDRRLERQQPRAAAQGCTAAGSEPSMPSAAGPVCLAQTGATRPPAAGPASELLLFRKMTRRSCCSEEELLEKEDPEERGSARPVANSERVCPCSALLPCRIPTRRNHRRSGCKPSCLLVRFADKTEKQPAGVIAGLWDSGRASDSLTASDSEHGTSVTA